jgi:hypothetical protein
MRSLAATHDPLRTPEPRSSSSIRGARRSDDCGGAPSISTFGRERHLVIPPPLVAVAGFSAV